MGSSSRAQPALCFTRHGGKNPKEQRSGFAEGQDICTAVTARLDNIEKMIEQLNKGFNEIKSTKVVQWPPLLQVNGVGAQPSHGQLSQVQQGQIQQGQVQQSHGHGQLAQGQLGVGQQHLALKTRTHGNIRARSPSIKRSADAAELGGAQSEQSQGEMPWSQVVGRNQGRKPRKVQYGTAARVEVAGGEAAPYDVVIGNTNPRSTEAIITEVLKKVADNLPEELKLDDELEILEVECLTKQRDDGSRIWSKTWRVQVPNKFREHMMRPEAYPAGWNCRKYFPPRSKRPPVPELDPTLSEPPVKKANIQIQQNIQH